MFDVVSFFIVCFETFIKCKCTYILSLIYSLALNLILLTFACSPYLHFYLIAHRRYKSYFSLAQVCHSVHYTENTIHFYKMLVNPKQLNNIICNDY